MNNNKRQTYKRQTYKRQTGKRKQYIRRVAKYNGGSGQHKEIPDNLGDNLQEVATRLNESITDLSKNMTTKDGLEYLFKLLEHNIDNNGNQVKNNLNYFNNSVINTSIKLIKFITCVIKQQVEKVLEQMEQGKGTINNNMNQYTKHLNDTIEEYSKTLIDTIHTTKQYIDDVDHNLPKATNIQNGNKKKKTIKKIHY